MLTKKYYELIAGALANTRPDAATCGEGRVTQWRYDVRELSERFAADNPKFDRAPIPEGLRGAIMRIKETKIYTYAELSDDAKAKARDWLRECNAGDNFFAESATESFLQELTALGFNTREKDISWSGFSSQGDGAAFSGTWYCSDFEPAALLADRPATFVRDGKPGESKENAELHRIAGELAECKKAGLLNAAVATSFRSHFMSLDNAEHDQPEDIEESHAELHDAYVAACGATEKRFLEAARDLASAFYSTLMAEYDYQNSDEQIAESIEENGYEFTEDGSIACTP